MTDVPTQPTPQPAAPPVEAAAPVAEPTATAAPPPDPRLAHLLQHYLPEGVDLATEIMHVVQGVGPQGEPTFHYRPLVPAPAPAVDTPPTDAAPPVPSPVTAAPQPAAPQPAAPVVGHMPAIPGYSGQPIVAAAPQPVAQGLDANPAAMTPEQFGAWYDAMLNSDS